MALAGLDRASRIAPAVFFQPHFDNIVYSLLTDPKGNTILDEKNLEKVRGSPFLQGFPYIKTFTPLRRFTTSHAASVKFMYEFSVMRNRQLDAGENGQRRDFRAYF